ncbi:hypothetical protein BDP27DRAFT_1369434 [Rhodocollybia butyracea]|uniref:Protein-S-isoprenylcysteine O-methyltransferase n=1 Tax=Rhodocollybia butyracea TaxID=206335 RepID=A0A9P5PB26_9AGAR|nr:hypothetical protein BDP27DRAFT_1372428 [Rhodocollybia butyracea]KAF9061686.1 hypothetical protein BDP27DRAFT_1369434 [Rhodocollybia butyracea]
MSYYIAGIHITHARGIESIVATSTIAMFAFGVRDIVKASNKSEKEGGEIIAGPKTLMETLITPIHSLVVAAAPLPYLVGIFLNRMEQPECTRALAWTRTAACVGVLGSAWALRVIVRTLDKQFHFIGTRERSELVSSGPFRIVRHPLYSSVLINLGLLSVAFWSWTPLVNLVLCLGAFAYKISVEERLMIEDHAMGPAYVAYKKQVPYRLIPYIW